MGVIDDRIGRRTHDLMLRNRGKGSRYAAWLENARRKNLIQQFRVTEADERRITETGDLRIHNDG